MADYSPESVWSHYSRLLPNPPPAVTLKSTPALNQTEMESRQNQSNQKLELGEVENVAGFALDVGSDTYESDPKPIPGSAVNQEMNPIWDQFIPIYDSASDCILAATCKACLFSVSSQPFRLQQHLSRCNSGEIGTGLAGRKEKKKSRSTDDSSKKVDSPLSAPPPLKNSCFICCEIPKKRSVFESLDKYPPHWSESIGLSLCRVLELENDESKDVNPLLRILATGIYCSTCAQTVRDINWIHQTISSLNSKLTNLQALLMSRIRVGSKSSHQRRVGEGKGWNKSGFVQNLKYRRQVQSPIPVEIKEETPVPVTCEEIIPETADEYITADLNIDSDEDFDVGGFQETSDDESDFSPSKRIKRQKKTTPPPRHPRQKRAKGTAHNTKRSKPVRIPCPIDFCTRKFLRPCKLEIHVRKDHENDPLPYHCNVLGCGAKFNFRTKLENHRQTHTDQEKGTDRSGSRSEPLELPCPIPECQRVFRERRAVNRHVENFHRPRLNSRHCQFCSKTFHKSGVGGMEATEKLVQVHESMHRSHAIPFSCILDSCTLSFQNSKELRKHVASEHEENLFHCELCPGSAFAFRGSLNEHKRRIHKGTGEVFKCNHPGCSYSTTVKPNLDFHKKRHTEERPYPCDQCDQSYKSKRNLASHFSIKHSEETPYKCPQCGDGFKSSRLLNKHEANHTGGAPVHLCEGCGQQFVNASNLMTHVRYRCPKGPQLASEDVESYRNKCREATRTKRAQWRSLYGYDRLPPPNKRNHGKPRKVDIPGSNDSPDGEMDQRVISGDVGEGDFDHHVIPHVSGTEEEIITYQAQNEGNFLPFS